MPKSGRGSKALFAMLLAAWASGEAWARPQTAESRIFAVVVRVEGEDVGPDLLNLVPIAVGDPYLPKPIDDAVKRLYRTGLFSDVEVWAEGTEEVRLTFFLRRKRLVRSIMFSGETDIPRKKLLAGLYALRPDAEYSDPRMKRAEGELREVMRREGFLNADVRAKTVSVPDRPVLDIDFEIIPGTRFKVRSVDFRGGLEGVQTDLLNSMATRPGQPYQPSALESDFEIIKSRYGALGYPRAEAAVQNRLFRETDATIGLVIRIVPHERVRITIRGADVPEALVRPLWEERIFEDWGLGQAEAAILTHLRKKGYIFASVRSSIERSADELHIIHEVDPGTKTRLSAVIFEGVTTFPEAEIRRVLGLTPQFPFFGGVDGDQLFTIPPRLETFYKNQGFPDARATIQFKPRENKSEVVIVIEEGPRQIIQKIFLRDPSILPVDELKASLESREKGPFTGARIRRDAEFLTSYYLNKGIRGTTIAARAEPVGADLFDVYFEIREGRPTRIEKIVVSGNAVTRRDLVDRQLLIREGDPARADLILESKRRLEKLGVFIEVKIDELPSADGWETLVVSLREGERNYVSLGVGLETKNEPMTFEVWNNVIRPRFTAEFIRGNMLGRAAQLSLVGQFSLKEKRAVAAWEAPTLFGLAYQSSLSAWLEREERASYGFDRRGVSLSAFREVGKNWTSLTTVRLASTTLYFLEIAESEIDRQFFPYSATSISESLIWEGRDDNFNPTRGHFFSAVVEWAYPLFNAESDYLKSFVKFQYFLPIGGRVLLLATGRGGLGMGRIPIHERFFAGGSSSFRGEPFDGLGPKDPSSEKPIGGKAILLFNFEAQVKPFGAYPAVSLAFFYDKGNVYANRKDLGLDSLEDALGFGLRYRTPLGPLRVDLGWNLRASEGHRGPRLYVTIGNVF